MPAIPTLQYEQLYNILLKCAPVDANNNLQALFVDASIATWRFEIPGADSPAGRVALLIDFLAHRQNNEGVNALLLFLHVLHKRHNPADACHGELQALIYGLADILEGAVPNEQRLILPDEPAPYRWLDPFQQEQAGFFFGREREKEELRKHLAINSFVAIIGVSGSGKSSLVRAGLLPKMVGEILSLSPGTQPLTRLAAQLSRLSPAGVTPSAVKDLTQQLQADPAHIVDVLEAWLATRPGSDPIILFIDQFEELFTQTQNEAERHAFAKTVMEIKKKHANRIKIILTLRIDFLPRTHALPGWQNLRQQDQYILGSLSDEGLRSAIEEPALARDATFEKGLVAVIMKDAGNRPGILPLLQVALTQLWQHRLGPYLTHTAYENIKGVGGAINWSADTVYQNLDPIHQQQAQTLFTRLVHLSEDTDQLYTRNLVKWDELNFPQADRDYLIAQLTTSNARLITTSQEGLQLTHESLITAWEQLDKWLKDHRQALLTRQRLTQNATLWLANNQDSSYLYTGQRLQEALAHIAQHERSPLEQDFLKASQEYEAKKEAEKEEAARKSRQLLALIIVLVGGVLLFLAYQQLLASLARDQTALVVFDKTVTIPVSEKDTRPVKPTRMVTVEPFSIEQFEVSNYQYRLCVRALRCAHPSDKVSYKQPENRDLPVVYVTAEQARRYCTWIGRRLPTEIEWVRAAYGEENLRFPWGNAPPTPERANLHFLGESDEQASTLVPVKALLPGATLTDLPIHNLIGNVWEWTSTIYQDTYPYEPHSDMDWSASNYNNTTELTFRGGGFESTLQEMESGGRTYFAIDERTGGGAPAKHNDYDLGFRCAEN